MQEALENVKRGGRIGVVAWYAGPVTMDMNLAVRSNVRIYAARGEGGMNSGRSLALMSQGKIVAEGTPAELKAEIGRPSVHAIPRTEEDRPKIAEFLAQFGEPLASTRDVAVRLREGLGLTDIVRAVDANGVEVADLELHAPTLDDVFLAKTGRTLEGAAEEAGTAGQESRRA